jgi:hypothetical protein
MEDQKINNHQSGEGFSNFISFKKFISTFLIQILYVIGVIFITISGLSKLFEKQSDMFGYSVLENNALLGLLIIILGNLLWRLVCEASIVIFSMHDTLSAIEHELKRK